MDFDQLSLEELLREKELISSGIENCKFERKLFFDNKGILHLLQKAHRLVQEGLIPDQAHNEIQKDIRKIQEDFSNIDLNQDKLYKKLNEVNIAIQKKQN